MLEKNSLYCASILLMFFLLLAANDMALSLMQSAMVNRRELRQQYLSRESVAATAQEAKRAKEAADLFVHRFYETLDFGIVFEEMSASDAGQRLKKANFFQGLNISPELVAKLDDRTLRQIYERFMNLYYLRLAYNLSHKSQQTSKTNTECRVPWEIAETIKASPYRDLLSNPITSDTPVINTESELARFANDLKHIAALYRTHLSRSVFNSPNYKANVQQLNDYRKVGFQVKTGLPALGIDEKTKVYIVEKDIFIIIFLEERGDLKILTVNIE